MKLIPLDQAKGKTVKAYTQSMISASLVVVFTDETFLVLSAGEGWYDEPTIEEGIPNDDLERFCLDFGVWSLIPLGVITKEDAAAWEAAANARREEAERHEYNKLRAKFEGKK